MGGYNNGLLGSLQSRDPAEYQRYLEMEYAARGQHYANSAGAQQYAAQKVEGDNLVLLLLQ